MIVIKSAIHIEINRQKIKGLLKKKDPIFLENVKLQFKFTNSPYGNR